MPSCMILKPINARLKPKSAQRKTDKKVPGVKNTSTTYITMSDTNCKVPFNNKCVFPVV